MKVKIENNILLLYYKYTIMDKYVNMSNENTINKSELKTLVISILQGKRPQCLENFSKKFHTSSLTFHDLNTNTVSKMIEIVSSSENFKDYVLSRINLHKNNKIDIDIHIQKSNNILSFYLIGPDLKYYHMHLLKIINQPKTGTNHSKWYNWSEKDNLISMAVNLRLLELYLWSITLIDEYETKTIGVLGLEVPFTIPKTYSEDSLIISSSNILSENNPTKISPGIFYFGKNGMSNDTTKKLLDNILVRYSHIAVNVYPDIIMDYNLDKFITSTYNYAICCWNRHARILIKRVKNCDILIIDPWMDGLPRKIQVEIHEVNKSKYKIGFLSRKVKDQNKEGSCVLCVFSRLLYLVEYPDIKKNPFTPIPDFYAYMVNLLYREITKL